MKTGESRSPSVVDEPHAKLDVSAKLEQAIEANLRRLGYGG